MTRAENAALTQVATDPLHGMRASTRNLAPCTQRRCASAAHIRSCVRATKLPPASQRCPWRCRVCIGRSAEHTTTSSVLREARALDAREFVWLVMLTERVARSERRGVDVPLPVRDRAPHTGQRHALALQGSTDWGAEVAA